MMINVIISNSSKFPLQTYALEIQQQQSPKIYTMLYNKIKTPVILQFSIRTKKHTY